jgi:hypothetical protein
MVFTCNVYGFNDFFRSNHDSVQVIQRALKEVGVKEDLGPNRGHRVNDYLCTVNMAPGNPWCSAFVAAMFWWSNIITTITAWSPSAFPKNKVIWTAKSGGQTPRSGDVGGLYYKNLGRIGHNFLIWKWSEGGYAKTIEGNTNAEGSREGDQVAVRRRWKKSINRVSRWIED